MRGVSRMANRSGARRTAEAGISLTEILMVIAVMGILLAVGAPRISAVLSRSGASQATTVVAMDLQQAVSLAARQRKPVRVACDCANGTYTVTDRATGSVLLRRRLTGNDADYNLRAVAFSATPVDVFPSGRTSAPLTVTLTSGTVSKSVTMTTGGLVVVAR